MSVFRLNEVSFNTRERFDRTDGGSMRDYKNNFYRYPENLGSSEYNHYILFEIFVRDNISRDLGGSGPASGDQEQPVSYAIREALAKTRGQNLSQVGSNLLSKFSSGVSNKITSSREAAEIQNGGSGVINSSSPKGGILSPVRNDRNSSSGVSQESGGSLLKSAVKTLTNELPRAFNTLVRSRDTIALYMPDTLQFNYSHAYEDMKKNDLKGAAALQFALSGANSVSSKNFNNMTPFLAETLDKLGPTQGLAAGSLGYAVNPNFEVIYSSTNLRTFQFDFLFYPKSESEALEVFRIIRAFKFHAAPEIKNLTAGRYLNAPSAFDISFHYNGITNPNLPRIATCVCTNVSVDYAPNGWSAYETGNERGLSPRIGETGTPVATRMTLEFREMTMITKELLRQTSSTLRSGINESTDSYQNGIF